MKRVDCYFRPKGLQVEFDGQRGEADRWKTLRPHTFRFAAMGVTVPADFTSDLASIPRLLQCAISPNGRHVRAALFHDYLYRTQHGSRFEADAVFRAIMDHDGVGWWTSSAMFYAVRLFGGKAWTKNRRALRKVSR